MKERTGGATIRDVARHADVSIGTVSRFLNGYILKPKNSRRIEAAIQELGFKENLIAKGLKNNRTMTVGVVIDDLTDNFMTSVVSTMETWFEKHGYSIMLCDYHGDEQILNRKLQFLLDRHVDGLVLFPFGDCRHVLYEYTDAGIPIVLVNDDIPDVAADRIQVDNRESVQGVIARLHAAGHRSIGLLSGREGSFTAIERMEGYRAGMAAAALPVDPGWVRCGHYTERGGYDAMLGILKDHPEVTAVFSSSYWMTMGAVLACIDADISIPGDISLVTYDNLNIFSMIRPPLSVIEQPLALMGETAATVLHRRMGKDMEGFPHTFVLPTTYIQRDSVRTFA